MARRSDTGESVTRALPPPSPGILVHCTLAPTDSAPTARRLGEMPRTSRRETGRLQLDDVSVRIMHVDGGIAFVVPERKAFALQGVSNGVSRAILRACTRVREWLDPDAPVIDAGSRVTP